MTREDDLSRTQLIEIVRDNKRMKKIIDSVIVAAVCALGAWVWDTNVDLEKLKDSRATQQKFWQIHSQTRTEINEINRELNRPLFQWHLETSNTREEDE